MAGLPSRVSGSLRMNRALVITWTARPASLFGRFVPTICSFYQRGHNKISNTQLDPQLPSGPVW